MIILNLLFNFNPMYSFVINVIDESDLGSGTGSDIDIWTGKCGISEILLKEVDPEEQMIMINTKIEGI